jgi:hypothetical protein
VNLTARRHPLRILVLVSPSHRRVSYRVFTRPLCLRHVSAWAVDAAGPTISAMDLISLAIAAATFALLLALIYGIERI